MTEPPPPGLDVEEMAGDTDPARPRLLVPLDRLLCVALMVFVFVVMVVVVETLLGLVPNKFKLLVLPPPGLNVVPG